MKRLILGAAGLLLSTSALAGVSLSKSDEAKLMPQPAAWQSAVQPKAVASLDDSMIHNAMLIDWPTKNAASVETASVDVKAMDEPKLLQAEPLKPVDTTEPMTDEMAAKPAEAEPMPADSAETPVPAEPVTTPNDGMGGPIETAGASAAALDLSPHPAAQNYPACAPGPGDDRCIQLYEPGVQGALASWSGQTGGFDNGRTGMGGPEEALDESSAIRARDDQAAYEPLPEDVVMPSSKDEVAKADSLEDTTLAI